MDDREREIAEQLAGRYEILELIGRGGFAAVYRARNLRLQRIEALKVLSEKLTEEEDFALRFEQEARVAASLDHPNIVKIYDYGGLEDFFWFSMQFVAGPSLGRRLKSGVRLEQATAARIGSRLLDALRYSHDRGVIHRDIKPDNILIDREGRPYLTDFGVAKSQLSLVKTQAGTLLGSPAFMSPEQLQGKPLDGRSDVYSVGVTLYKALTGELPFTGDDTFSATMKRLSQRARPLSEVLPAVDPALEAIVMRSLEREPADRFADAGEFGAALEDLLGGAPGGDAPIPVGEGDDSTLVMTPSRGSRSSASRTPTFSRRLSGTAPIPIVPPAPAASGKTRMSLISRPKGVAAGLVALALLGVLVWMWRGRPREASDAPPRPTLAPAARPTAAAPTAPAALPTAPATLPTEPAALPTAPMAPPTEPPLPEPTVPPKKARVAAVPPRRRAATPAPEAVLPARAARQMPEIEQEAPIALPAEIRSRHSGASVGLSVTVGEDGTVKRATVISEVCPECDRAALDAVKHFRFKPARDAEGRPVEATLAIALRL